MEEEADLVCYPMHGEIKVIKEGFRTRDGHLIQWFSRLCSNPIRIFSRSEPWPRLTLARARTVEPSGLSPAVTWYSQQVLSIPSIRSRRDWWAKSATWYPTPRRSESRIAIWNPMVGLNDQLIAFIKSNNSHCLFDLLDDWTIHPAFKDIAKDVDYGYRALFEVASAVSANSEGTYELACRYGRPDVILLPNGCDPDLFSGVSHASGPTTIGYAGKLGFRLDVELIVEVCESLPHCNFLFAGPTIDKEPVRRIRNLANVELIGDVPYSKYPDLLTRFDIGWIPHRTGAGEIGGDAIKVYEYRASGLPVVMTPIIGSSRAPSGVIVGPREGVLSALQKLLRNAHGYRIQRAMAPFPEELTWKYKALLELKSVGIHQTDTS